MGHLSTQIQTMLKIKKIYNIQKNEIKYEIMRGDDPV